MKIQTLIYIRRNTTCHSQQVKHLQLLQKSSALLKKSSEHNTNTFIYQSVDNRRRWSFYKPRIVLILKKLNFYATKNLSMPRSKAQMKYFIRFKKNNWLWIPGPSVDDRAGPGRLEWFTAHFDGFFEIDKVGKLVRFWRLSWKDGDGVWWLNLFIIQNRVVYLCFSFVNLFFRPKELIIE